MNLLQSRFRQAKINVMAKKPAKPKSPPPPKPERPKGRRKPSPGEIRKRLQNPPRPKRGRPPVSLIGHKPTSYTPELGLKICCMIIQGNWLSTAASSVGISHQTLDSWLRKGNEVIKIGHPQSEGDKDLADFACWVHQATAMAEERDVQRLDQFCDLDWKPLLAKMGRRYGKNWSAPATETNVNQKTEAKVEHLGRKTTKN